MKAEIREILKYVNEHPEMTTIESVKSYFDQFLFSLEKQEWDSLTNQDKRQFADQLDLQTEQSQKGSGPGDN